MTDAFLRIDGGTPEAAVSIDGKDAGKLDASGSVGPLPIAPGTDHVIRLQKANFEPLELKRKAGARETITLAGGQARLKQFGTLVFEVVDPPGTLVTIERSGESPRKITEKSVSVREGTYSVSGTANQYPPYQSQAQVTSGQSTPVRVVLTKRIEPVKPTESTPKRVELKDLFRSQNGWKDEDGFWVREETAFMKANQFRHTFDVLRIRKNFGRREKPQWRVYTSEDDYIEAMLDDTNLAVRQRVGGKETEWQRKPHRAGQKDFYRLELTVSSDRIVEKIGQAIFEFPGTYDGRTGFIGRFGLRLVN